jgi:protoporphyrinogen IX oxidase
MLVLIAKSLHIVAVISWFAMLFYLPRLFVYHAMTEDQAGRDRFKIMERKLYRVIGTPAMLATLLFGIWTAYYYWDYYSTTTWFWLKMGLVFLLIGYHHMCGAFIKKFAQDLPIPSHKFFRIFNEIPVLILLAVVFLVVLKQPA